jgi:hypothetical protein
MERQPDKLESDLRARIAARSTNRDDYLELADLLERACRFAEARELYRQALDGPLARTDMAAILWRLGSLLDSMGQLAEAASVGRRMLTLLADEPEWGSVSLYRGFAHALLAHVTWPNDPVTGASEARLAAGLLEEGLTQQMDDESITTIGYHELARLYGALGDFDRAAGYAMRCLDRQANPRDGVATLHVLAETLERAGRTSEAEQWLDRALEIMKENPALLQLYLPRLYGLRGAIKLSSGRHREARTLLEEALSALDHHEFLRHSVETRQAILWQLAQVRYEIDDFGRAAEALSWLRDSYSEKTAERYRALAWLGACYARVGRRDLARHAYSAVIASANASDEDKEVARDALSSLG